MKVAALYDIHGNLPALTAVLADVEREDVDLIICGGDCAQGPMPSQTIDCLQSLRIPARFVMGNADQAMIDAFEAGDSSADSRPDAKKRLSWSAGQLSRVQRDFLASFEPTVHVDVSGLAAILFCHGSPRSNTEIITAVSPPDRLMPMLDHVAEGVVVCGHTHRQFDLTVDGKRVLNAGSVGAPYEGDAAAFWLLLGERAEMRRTSYDVGTALETFRATGYPDADEALLESLIEPTDPDWVSRHFEEMAAKG